MKEETAIEIMREELKFALEKLWKIQDLDKMTTWAALETVAEFVKHDLDRVVGALETAQTSLGNVEDQIADLEKELEEAEERAHKAEQEIEKMTEHCTGCNRPAEYCGCDEDWRRDR